MNIRFIGWMFLAMVGSDQLIGAVPTRIISLESINEGMVQDFIQGKLRDYAVECPAGASLPLKIVVKGEWLSLGAEENAPLQLKILKTCYIRHEGDDNFLFSTDLHNWKGFLEFFTGEIKATVDNQGGGPIAGFEIELNQR